MTISKVAATIVATTMPKECAEVSDMVASIHKRMTDAIEQDGGVKPDYVFTLKMNRDQAVSMIAIFTYGADMLLNSMENKKG